MSVCPRRLHAAVRGLQDGPPLSFVPGQPAPGVAADARAGPDRTHILADLDVEDFEEPYGPVGVDGHE